MIRREQKLYSQHTRAVCYKKKKAEQVELQVRAMQQKEERKKSGRRRRSKEQVEIEGSIYV